MKSKEIDVSVIYVNYKTSFLLEESIKSLLEFSICFTYEIIIVDNSCSDEERIKLIDISNRYNVRLIVLPENNGFGCANNEASKIASGKYLYFLNCDTKLISNACFELFSFLKITNLLGWLVLIYIVLIFFPLFHLKHMK